MYLYVYVYIHMYIYMYRYIYIPLHEHIHILLKEEIRLEKLGSRDLSVFLIDLVSNGDSVCTRENCHEYLGLP